MLGTSLMGFNDPKDDAQEVPYTPNRAQRRAAAQERKRQQRQGQRAWERRRVLREQAIGILSDAEDQS